MLLCRFMTGIPAHKSLATKANPIESFGRGRQPWPPMVEAWPPLQRWHKRGQLHLCCVCPLSPIFWLVNYKLFIIEIKSQSQKIYNLHLLLEVNCEKWQLSFIFNSFFYSKTFLSNFITMPFTFWYIVNFFLNRIKSYLNLIAIFYSF